MRIDDPETPTIAALVLRPSRPALRPVLAAAVAVLLAGACGDNIQGPADEGNNGPPDEPSVALLSTLIVSNPVTSASTAGANLSFSGVSSSEDIVFVSLRPGSVANGETAVIQTRGTEAQATATMADGGFDPVPVAAGTGDTLDIRIELAGGGAPLVFYAVVPPTIPPVIVRTDPPPKKRDVPLNAVMLVVFSEPIDAATLTVSSVQLLLDGAAVAGTLQFGDGEHLTVTFAPDEPLTPEAEYMLLVTQAIKDLDGDALEEELRIDFTTEGASEPPPISAEAGTYEQVTQFSSATIDLHDGRLSSRYVLYEDGVFSLQYESARWGFFEYTGRYSPAGQPRLIALDFDDSNGHSGELEWQAAGTLVTADCMLVEYNFTMKMADFEDAEYCRQSGAS